MIDPEHNAANDERNTDRDLLLSRVVDGRDSPDDWASLDAIARNDPGLWRELALLQKDQRSLEQMVGLASASADRTPLPADAPTLRLAEHARPGSGWSGWIGWAAAAGLGLALVGTLNVKPSGSIPGNHAGVIPVQMTPDEALENYITVGSKDGRVLGELEDRILIRGEPAADGAGWDVVFVRPIVERARVPDLYRFATDEWGNPTGTAVKVTPRRFGPG
ncbi:MAG: hypothetical protein HRU70_06525 [Phycisphaeraceae bacterium]|nr:MAG: hypothetical protein HRU70_06525 [Phycisphaeraceae bacterium]